LYPGSADADGVAPARAAPSASAGETLLADGLRVKPATSWLAIVVDFGKSIMVVTSL